MKRVLKARSLWLCGALGGVTLLALNGCALIGDHVKSSFACASPEGICAPTSAIDDRALAMIAGETAPPLSPAGPYEQSPKSRASHVAVVPATRTPVRSAEAGRTREHVLRLVFQPYIDERGRLHEASALRMVVAGGQWSDDGVSYTPGRGEPSAATASGLSLAAAVDAAEPREASVDQVLPDPAAVAAARARAADPVGTIKSDVAARLAKPPRGTASVSSFAGRAAPATPEPTPANAAPGLRTPSAPQGHASPQSAPADGSVQASTGKGFITPPPRTAPAREVETRVKADPRLAEQGGQAQSGAKRAASDAGAVPSGAEIKAKITAAGFPGAPAEGN